MDTVWRSRGACAVARQHCQVAIDGSNGTYDLFESLGYLGGKLTVMSDRCNRPFGAL
jgi:hypothetical protein